MPHTHFAPLLYIPNKISDIEFYKHALGATETWRINNEDGSIHVAELSIDGAIFHLHEVTQSPSFFEPALHQGCTAIVGLFVDDVDALMDRAISAGAKVISPAHTYEYNYRQGQVEDPFGHHWVIQKKV